MGCRCAPARTLRGNQKFDCLKKSPISTFKAQTFSAAPAAFHRNQIAGAFSCPVTASTAHRKQHTGTRTPKQFGFSLFALILQVVIMGVANECARGDAIWYALGMTAKKETTSNAPRKIVSIIRVSSDQQAQDEKTGLRRQEEDIEIHCKTMNLTVVKKFELPGIGGSNVQNTKAYRKMVEALNRPDVVGICFSELSRFFRPENITTLSDVFRPLPKDTLLFCDLGEISLTDPNDMIKLALWGSMAGHEKARIKNRMQRGKAILRAMPDAKIDPLPKGVSFIRTSDRHNTGTFRYSAFSGTVKEAFIRVAAGQKMKRVAQDLGFGNQVSLRACLKSRWWIGEKCMTKKRVNRVWNVEKDKLTSGSRVAHPEPIAVKTNLAATPLVSSELFNAVQDLLAENHKTWTQNKTLVNEFLGA